MAEIKVKCPYCRSEEVSLYGKSRSGKQRYLCRNKACSHKTFQLEYKNNACRPGMKEKIVEMTSDVPVGQFLHSRMANTTYRSVRGEQRNIKLFHADFLEFYREMTGNWFTELRC